MTRTVSVAAAALALAACTGSTPGQPDLAIFDQEPGTQDALPPTIEMDGKDPSTVRFAAESGGFRFYLARPADESGVCLIQFADENPDQWGSICKTDGGPVLTANLLGYESEAAVVADGADVEDFLGQGYTSIHQNILVRR